MVERARLPLAEIAAGDSVIIYAKVDGVIDEESLREGHVQWVENGETWIKYETFENLRAWHYSLFYALPGSRLYKSRVGDSGLPTIVYFALLDEDFI